MFVSVATAKITEMLVQIFFCTQHFNFRDFVYSVATNDDITVVDGSAAVTGLLLAFALPPTVPLWLPVVGAVFSVVVAKHLFGGLGYNIFNPALAGRAFLLAACLAPVAAIGAPIGARLTHRLPVDWVRNAFYGLLVITGLRLLLH